MSITSRGNNDASDNSFLLLAHGSNCSFHPIIIMAEAGSLLATDENSNPSEVGEPQQQRDNFSTKVKLLLAAIVLAAAAIMIIAFSSQEGTAIYNGQPSEIRILLPPSNPFSISLGENRVLDVVFYNGNDDRASNNYQPVTKREIEWGVSPKGIVDVDIYGTLTTLAVGTVNVTVKSKHNSDVYHTRSIKVEGKALEGTPQRTIIVNSQLKAPLNKVLQKIVSFFTRQQALLTQNLPASIKDFILNPEQAPRKIEVKRENIVWSVVLYADGSGNSYIQRFNPDEGNKRDITMHLMGNRYLPGSGLSVSSIEDDGLLGIWTVNKAGQVSHIEMKAISYKQKAYQMSKDTENSVMRHGLASDSVLVGDVWKGTISDNDGLWTGMYAVGQLMRYSSLKKRADITDVDKEEARKSALYPLKAVLLIANIACRDKTVDSRIRHFINTRKDEGAFLSSEFLIQNRPFSTDSYPNSPADGVGLFGIDAGTNTKDYFLGGKKRYTSMPFVKEDWSKDSSKDTPATTKRKLNGFWARTFVIEKLDGNPGGGLFFKHNDNGTQTVVSDAQLLYDFGKDDQPVLDLGQGQLPDILKRFLNISGVQYTKSDLYYKGDTSTDEVIGHIFLYKVAFDVLDEADPEEKELKELVKTTMVNFCTLLTNNGYNFVDATGQGTKWGKIVREFLLSDFTIEDSPLKALELLLCFKLCYYMTGEERWKIEYEFLIHDKSYRYLDLVADFWKRWRYLNFNEDYDPDSKFFHLDPSVKYDEKEVIRHVLHSFHFSDDEEAFLAFYLAFQLEDNPEYLKKYKEGIDSYWVLISRSQNPLWYLIYQLTSPNQPVKDYYNNDILEIAAWQLSRTNIATRKTAAFIEGSRKDVWIQGNKGIRQCSFDPLTVIGRRKHETDALSVSRDINYKIDPNYDPMNIYDYKVLPADERSIHKFNGATFDNIFSSSVNGMEAATIYTLPYWLGVYHGMIDLD